MRIIAKQRQLRFAVPSHPSNGDLGESWRTTSFDAISPMRDDNGDVDDMATDETGVDEQEQQEQQEQEQ